MTVLQIIDCSEFHYKETHIRRKKFCYFIKKSFTHLIKNEFENIVLTENLRSPPSPNFVGRFTCSGCLQCIVNILSHITWPQQTFKEVHGKGTRKED